MKTWKLIGIPMLCIGLVTTASAQQENPITIQINSQKVVITTEASGQKVEKLETMDAVLPGDIVQYRVTCKNNSNETATNLVIGNPLPKELLYLEGSATTDGTKLQFSADGGKTFKPADELTVTEADGLTRSAVPADYTHIQWILSEPLKPKTTKEVTYRVRLK